MAVVVTEVAMLFAVSVSVCLSKTVLSYLVTAAQTPSFFFCILHLNASSQSNSSFFALSHLIQFYWRNKVT